MTILVTGATGNLGSEVVNALSRRGIAVRAGTRDPRKLALQDGVTAVKAVFEDVTTFDEALNGVDGLFLIAPPADSEAPAKLKPVVELAKAKGVTHIVFNSAYGANLNERAPLRIVEHGLIESGVNYSILRPNFFMENFSSGYLAPAIKHQRSIFLPAGDGKTSFIATRDIGEAAAALFAEKVYNEEYNLTGPESLDHYEVARTITEAAGVEIKYHPLSEEETRTGSRQMGMPDPVIDYLLMLYSAVRAGYTAAVTEDVKLVTGRDATRFADFAVEHAADWQ